MTGAGDDVDLALGVEGACVEIGGGAEGSVPGCKRLMTIGIDATHGRMVVRALSR